MDSIRWILQTLAEKLAINTDNTEVGNPELHMVKLYFAASHKKRFS